MRAVRLALAKHYVTLAPPSCKGKGNANCLGATGSSGGPGRNMRKGAQRGPEGGSARLQ